MSSDENWTPIFECECECWDYSPSVLWSMAARSLSPERFTVARSTVSLVFLLVALFYASAITVVLL